MKDIKVKVEYLATVKDEWAPERIQAELEKHPEMGLPPERKILSLEIEEIQPPIV